MLTFRDYGECPAWPQPVMHDFQVVSTMTAYRNQYESINMDNLTEPYTEATIICRFCFGKDVIETRDIYPGGKR